MRFKQYITEEEDNYYKTLKNGFQNIYTKCMPFINELINSGSINHKLFMYSGRKESNDIIKNKVKLNRSSRTMDKNLSKIYDELFYKEFKWKPRTNSIFCTNDSFTANNYGTLYLIFPIDKYKYLWSPKIDDLLTNNIIEKIHLKYYKMMKKHLNLSFFNKMDISKLYNSSDTLELKQDFKNELNKVIKTYKTTDLDKALLSGNEIMVNTKEYYGLKDSLFTKPLLIYMNTYSKKFPTDEIFDEFYNGYKSVL